MIFTEEDIQKHHEQLEKLAKKGERMGSLTKYLTKHVFKFIWLSVALVVGGSLWFIWGYFSKVQPEKRKPLI
jgi:cell division septal protein FtsQ